MRPASARQAEILEQGLTAWVALAFAGGEFVHRLDAGSVGVLGWRGSNTSGPNC